MVLATIKAGSETEIPCANHNAIPVTDMVYMPSEMDSTSLVFKTLIICGKKPNVVKQAAIYPIIKTYSLLIIM